MALIIRHVTENDAEVVARLLTELSDTVGGDGMPPGPDRLPENVIVSAEQARQRLRATAGVETALLAEVGGVAVGLVAVRIVAYLGQDVPYAEVTQLYVTPDHRHRGVARALMAQAEELARSRGCTSVHVIAGRNNATAEGFYQAIGYEPLYHGFEKFL
jgi:GNAT superfamily N-acetyltransferase